jgi:uncharacterized protein (DUF2249 family)
MNQPTATARVDVRAVPPRERHPLILSTFASLPAGQTMELVNDHDPRPLYDRFQAEMRGGFSWDYLQQGPDIWRVAITRLKTAHASGQCCGSCGGA